MAALANYTHSFFYPTLEQGGAREYSAEYLATVTVDPATTGRQWRYQQCAELGWFANAAPTDPVRSPLVTEAYQRSSTAKVWLPALAVPQLLFAPCASSARAWRLWGSSVLPE